MSLHIDAEKGQIEICSITGGSASGRSISRKHSWRMRYAITPSGICYTGTYKGKNIGARYGMGDAIRNLVHSWIDQWFWRQNLIRYRYMRCYPLEDVHIRDVITRGGNGLFHDLQKDFLRLPISRLSEIMTWSIKPTRSGKNKVWRSMSETSTHLTAFTVIPSQTIWANTARLGRNGNQALLLGF